MLFTWFQHFVLLLKNVKHVSFKIHQESSNFLFSIFDWKVGMTKLMMIIKTLWTKSYLFCTANELHMIVRMVYTWILNHFLMFLMLIDTQWIFFLGVVLFNFTFFFLWIDVFSSHWVKITMFLIHILLHCLKNFEIKRSFLDFGRKLQSFLDLLFINYLNFFLFLLILTSLLASLSRSSLLLLLISLSNSNCCSSRLWWILNRTITYFFSTQKSFLLLITILT